ncbi:hypothetical protein [Acinetobacter sp. SWAC57]|uniref:hypothetical protein n=1 Tax=Acinetobacter sp. SWAC57 TaxID=2293834 RepID=UPI000E5BEB41|nr:hypothetical protein [Acinetobacter sp. SWAC57]RGD90534.1 hypothetical protein DYI96_10195 [Acinetobacter sp. SWAC57]
MDIQEQKNLYLAKLLEQEVIKQDEFEDLVFKPEINAFHSNYLSSRFMDNINFGWSAWQAATAQAVPKGFVLVLKDQFEHLNEFKDLYKRAITNARKRKGQLNWAHVASLGVGSSRAIELCKTLNIDPSATNMHEVIKAQEQSHDTN